MKRNLEKRLLALAEETNQLLNMWRINTPITLVARKKAPLNVRHSFWGFGKWFEPERVFVWGREEIGAIIEKVRANIGERIEFYPFGKKCYVAGKSIQISPAEALALAALRCHLLETYFLPLMPRGYVSRRTKPAGIILGGLNKDFDLTIEIDSSGILDIKVKLRSLPQTLNFCGSIPEAVSQLLLILALSGI